MRDLEAHAPDRDRFDQQAHGASPQDMQPLDSTPDADAEATATLFFSFDETFLALSHMVAGLDQYHKAHDFEACHKVLGLPELCASILEYMNMWELRACAEAGGPLMEVITSTPKLAREVFLEFGCHKYGFPNPAIYWDTPPYTYWPSFSTGYRLGAPFWNPRLKLKGYSMDMDYQLEDLGGVVGVIVEGYNETLAALNSEHLMLQEYLGNRCIDIKLVVHNNPYWESSQRLWKGPPCALWWTAAELTIRLPRLGVLLGIVKKLYDCAEDTNKKLFNGELKHWHEATGVVEDLAWKDLFSSTEMDVIRSEQPIFRWFWDGHVEEGITFAQHRHQHAS